MASGRLADYLGKGDALDRPGTLDLHPEAVGFYFAEDTGEWSAWDGVQWIEDIIGGGIPDAPSDGSLYGRKDGDWEQVTGGSGADSYTIITEGSAFTAAPGTHDGRGRYIRAGGDVTFDSAEPYTAGMVFRIRATAAIELIEDGVTLSPTYGGTLQLEAGMGVEVVMTGATTADVNGLTVAA